MTTPRQHLQDFFGSLVGWFCEWVRVIRAAGAAEGSGREAAILSLHQFSFFHGCSLAEAMRRIACEAGGRGLKYDLKASYLPIQVAGPHSLEGPQKMGVIHCPLGGRGLFSGPNLFRGPEAAQEVRRAARGRPQAAEKVRGRSPGAPEAPQKVGGGRGTPQTPQEMRGALRRPETPEEVGGAARRRPERPQKVTVVHAVVPQVGGRGGVAPLHVAAHFLCCPVVAVVIVDVVNVAVFSVGEIIG